jgi:DNA-binding winged helix-turn-helix (wHTH) protein
MADTGRSDADRLRRRWSFAGCVFDEANWTLTVDGRRAQVENKPLELLRHLLLNAGNLVSKDDLLDAIWPDVMVVEASLPTAVRKLRTALGDDERETHIIETVPRIGYRLAVPVTVEEAAGGAGRAGPRDANDEGGIAAPPGRKRFGGRRPLLLAGMMAVGIGTVAIPLTSPREAPATKPAQQFSQLDAQNAIRRLDVDAIQRMLAAGWNPNGEMRGEGNAALHYAVEMCEWNPGHDRDRLLLMVRTLIEGGGQLERRNQWGDTPYSIAKAPRFCGPDHPVTRSMRATCSHDGVVMDSCLASYELARRARH